MFKYFIFYVHVCFASICVYSSGCGAQQRPEEPQKPWKRGGSCLGTAVWVVGRNPGLYKTAAPAHKVVLYFITLKAYVRL